MHAGVRRMPAERARHAKRLGHVQQGPVFFPVVAGPSSGNAMTTTTTTATTAPTPSATPSSSRALTSSSTTPSSSSAPSSATTPSASSVPFSPTTLSLPISSLTTYPAVPTSPTSSSTPSPPASVNAVSNSGLSGGAIAGIIAGAVIVGAALIVFFVRKTYLRRRERKHLSWNGPPGLGERVLDEPKPLPDISERPLSSHRIAPLSPFEAYGQSMYSTPVVHTQPPGLSAYAVPTPPPITYNNPAPVAPYHTRLAPSTYNPGNTTAPTVARVAVGTGISSTLPPVRAQHAPLEAMVKCTFVPTLPDELSITTGERIFVVEQYDDGWDLCANVRGERGMVPRECLEHAPIDQPDIGWRNAGRTSSLNPDGKRF